MHRQRLNISSEEVTELTRLINSRLDLYDSYDNEEFLRKLPLTAYRIPERIVEFLNEFRYNPSEEGFCVLSTGIIDDCQIGPTPPHWELETNNDTCQEAVMTMCLCATILGDIYGWLTQQAGRVVHDILPIKQHQGEQLGSGSATELTWHTEDAFHELRGDYLMLMCLRNHEQVPTTLSKPDYSKLTDRQIDILFEKQFTIKPDNSHKPANKPSYKSGSQATTEQKTLDAAYDLMLQRAEKPEKIAVLFGNKKDPCLRLDPYFMDEPDNPEAAEAMGKLIELVSESLIEVALDPGEIIVIDNYEVVHGRRPFKARYDGTDRWYKRINIIRDIRRCSEVLESKTSRVVY